MVAAAEYAARQAAHDASVDVESEVVEAGDRKRRRMDASFETCRNSYKLSFCSVAGANTRFLREHVGMADAMWEFREDRSARERESEASISVGVCRLVVGDEHVLCGDLGSWLECADDATPVVVLADLDAVPRLRDISPVAPLIGASGVC